VSELHLLRAPGLLSSEEQIPQIVVNIRIWQKAMDALEPMTVLHTQEVWGSSPRAPTTRIDTEGRSGKEREEYIKSVDLFRKVIYDLIA
jgi:hypothetical protein